jgi:hypothetical protein
MYEPVDTRVNFPKPEEEIPEFREKIRIVFLTFHTGTPGFHRLIKTFYVILEI